MATNQQSDEPRAPDFFDLAMRLRDEALDAVQRTEPDSDERADRVRFLARLHGAMMTARIRVPRDLLIDRAMERAEDLAGRSLSPSREDREWWRALDGFNTPRSGRPYRYDRYR